MKNERIQEKLLAEPQIDNLVDDTLMVIMSCLETTTNVNRFGNTCHRFYGIMLCFYNTPYAKSLKLAESLEKKIPKFIDSYHRFMMGEIEYLLPYKMRQFEYISIKNIFGMLFLDPLAIKDIATAISITDLKFWNWSAKEIKDTGYKLMSNVKAMAHNSLYRGIIHVLSYNAMHYNHNISFENLKTLRKWSPPTKFFKKYPFFINLQNQYNKKYGDLIQQKIEFAPADFDPDNFVPSELQKASLMLKNVLTSTKGSKFTLFKEALEQEMKTNQCTEIILNSYLQNG